MQKILIIQLSRLGDLVQTIPLLIRLKNECVKCHISVLCLREFAAIIEGLQSVDRLIQISEGCIPEEGVHEPNVFVEAGRRILGMVELKDYYDLVINLTHSLFSSQHQPTSQARKSWAGLRLMKVR